LRKTPRKRCGQTRFLLQETPGPCSAERVRVATDLGKLLRLVRCRFGVLLGQTYSRAALKLLVEDSFAVLARQHHILKPSRLFHVSELVVRQEGFTSRYKKRGSRGLHHPSRMGTQ